MNKKVLAIAITSSMILSACGSSSSNNKSTNSNKDTDVFNTLTIDASDREAYSYVDLNAGEVVDASAEWDIAFSRYNVIVNANRATAIVDSQNELYDEEAMPIVQNFVNLGGDVQTQEADLLAATTVQGEFVSSAVTPVLDLDALYHIDNYPAFTPTEDYYLLTSAEGNTYAKMLMSDYTVAPDHSSYAPTLSFYVEGVDGEGFADTAVDWTLELRAANGDTCFDFDSASVVDCTSASWDVKLTIAGEGRAATNTLYLNGGASGNGQAKAYMPDQSADDYVEYTSAEPSMTNGLTYTYQTDKAGSIFDSFDWYAYDVDANGDHSIDANFRVYALDTDTTSEDDEAIKFQIANYYNESGASGHITIRFVELSAAGE